MTKQEYKAMAATISRQGVTIIEFAPQKAPKQVTAKGK